MQPACLDNDAASSVDIGMHVDVVLAEVSLDQILILCCITAREHEVVL